MMVLVGGQRGWGLGRQLVHEGGTLMNRIGALIKKDPRELSHLLSIV